MKYILTEKELRRYEKRIEEKQSIINGLCQRVCDSEPISIEGCYKNTWGCIYSSDHKNEWYCDECPVLNICGKIKHFSK